MSTQIDTVLAQMAELTNAVKSSGRQNMQWEDVQKAFGAHR